MGYELPRLARGPWVTYLSDCSELDLSDFQCYIFALLRKWKYTDNWTRGTTKTGGCTLNPETWLCGERGVLGSWSEGPAETGACQPWVSRGLTSFPAFLPSDSILNLRNLHIWSQPSAVVSYFRKASISKCFNISVYMPSYTHTYHISSHIIFLY
jgi:hypothetical protein